MRGWETQPTGVSLFLVQNTIGEECGMALKANRPRTRHSLCFLHATNIQSPAMAFHCQIDLLCILNHQVSSGMLCSHTWPPWRDWEFLPPFTEPHWRSRDSLRMLFNPSAWLSPSVLLLHCLDLILGPKKFADSWKTPQESGDTILA